MKFKFNDKVKIVSGFYEGCIGYVKGYEFKMCGAEYYVEGHRPDPDWDISPSSHEFTSFFKENELEKIEE